MAPGAGLEPAGLSQRINSPLRNQLRATQESKMAPQRGIEPLSTQINNLPAYQLAYRGIYAALNTTILLQINSASALSFTVNFAKPCVS